MTALNPNVLTRPPPPPPPQDDISSFMDQWGGASQQEGEGQVLDSALAKLRAKKAAAAAAGPSQQNYNEPRGYNASQSGHPSRQNMMSAGPAGAHPRHRQHHYGPTGREIELDFNAKSFRMFDNIMRKNWDYLMQEMYDDLWVSVFYIKFHFD